MRMQSYLVVTPQEERAAARFTRAFVHAAYRIGPESALLRRELLMQTRGGLLSLSDRDAPAVEDPEKLAAALVRECARREYAGAVLDFQAPPSPDRRALAAAAAAALLRSRRLLYLPESYACGVQGGAAVVNTAVSGGSLEQRLRAARDRWGSRAALDLQRLAMDFTLPSLSGEGAALTVMQLADLLRREAPAVFFSQDLGARYFTYAAGGAAHFVLYDDAETLACKLRLGRSLGFSAAFLLYPETEDLLGRLFAAP
jgi:hypothetical protein